MQNVDVDHLCDHLVVTALAQYPRLRVPESFYTPEGRVRAVRKICEVLWWENKALGATLRSFIDAAPSGLDQALANDSIREFRGDSESLGTYPDGRAT